MTGGAAPSASPETCRAARDAYLAVAADLSARLRARGAHLLHATLETPQCGGEAHPMSDALTAALAPTGGAHRDLEHLLRAPGARLMPHDHHPSALGHAAVASALAQALDDSGWLGPCR